MSLWAGRSSIVSILVSALCGLGLGLLFGILNLIPHAHFRSYCPEHTLINPNLDCETVEVAIDQLTETETAVRTLIDSYKATGDVTRASVWVRHLASSQWMGIDEYNTYNPGSLLKVVILIAYLKLSEINPELMNTAIPFEKKYDNTYQIFPPEKNLTEGASYTVQELLEHMIRYSDNEAAQLLIGGLNESFVGQVMIELGIKIPISDNYEADFLTPKSYGNVFRILYNTSYLSQENSQYALELLTQTTFHEGLTKKLPPDIQVAQKFGERTRVDVEGKIVSYEFHNCGIVYLPNSSYSICVMSEGHDMHKLAELTQNISETVYKYQQ